MVNVLPDDRFYVIGVMGQLDATGRAQEDMVTVTRFTSTGYLDSNSFFGTAGLVRFDRSMASTAIRSGARSSRQPVTSPVGRPEEQGQVR